jgi:hypothetical protein
MKAKIKIVSANKQFNADQLAIMKRVMMVLTEHGLCVALETKELVKITYDNKLKKVV